MQKQGQVETKKTRGQSLVELALIFPILLLFFVGLIEVGWALHSYLVMANANREGARFAARGQSIFVEGEGDITNRVIAERVWASLSDQVEVAVTGDDPPQLVEEEGDLTIFVHRFYIATEVPGNPADDIISINDGDTASSCLAAAALAPESYRLGAETNRLGGAQNSKIDLYLDCEALVQENDEFNAKLDELYPDENIPYSVNEVVVVETIYQHELALKVPFVTAFIPDPMPLYISTQMRVVAGRVQ
jgi:hypothetical protein